MVENRTCKKCRLAKPLSSFPKRNWGDGRGHTCYRCKSGKPPLTPTPPEEFEITVEVPPVEAAHAAFKEEKAKRDFKREHAALLEENSRLRATFDAFLQLRQAPSVLVYDKPKAERSDSVACVVASDWHVEEPVNREAVHGLNEFNLEIAKSRAEHFFKNGLALAQMMGRDTTIKTLFLAKLGDFFSGWIHEELLANTLLPPGEAANFVAGLFISGIEFWLRESDYQIEVDAIPGNHGRMTDKVHLGDPTGTSLETFMYRLVAEHFHNNPRVKYRVSSQAMLYRRFYETFVMREIHGYEVKYGGGVGGITIPLNKAIAQWDNPIRADLTILGHFHQFFDGRKFLVNGSLIGYNTFAQAIKASYEEAVQAFFLVHARNGGVRSLTAPVWLDSAHKLKASLETTP